MPNFMEEAYQNPNFNKYDNGPASEFNEEYKLGAHSVEDSNKNCKSVQICLHNIPKDLTNDGLKNLCKKYGQVTRANIFKSYNNLVLGFVDFNSINEAELAIRKINQLPLGINAKFANKNKKTDNNYENNRNNKGNNVSQGNRSFSSNGSYKKSNGGTTINLENRESLEEQEMLKKALNESTGKYNSDKDFYYFKTDEMIAYPKTGKCVLCGKIAVKYCERCRDFYCSAQCQVNDWPTHRSICFAMPRLISTTTEEMSVRPECSMQQPVESKQTNDQSKALVEQAINKSPFQKEAEKKQLPQTSKQAEVLSNNSTEKKIYPNPTKTDDLKFNKVMQNAKLKISDTSVPTKLITTNELKKAEKTEFPKSTSNVALTAFINSKKCYIRSLEPKLNEEYVKMLSEVAKYSITAKYLTECPERGSIVLANFQDTGFFRSIVLNSENSEKIKIVYIDFGNNDVKSYKELKYADSTVTSHKNFIHCASLKDINENETNDSVVTLMNNMVDNSLTLRITYTGEHTKSTECELIITQNNENVNKKIQALLNVKTPVKEETAILLDDLADNKIKLGDNISIIILDKSSIKSGVVSFVDVAGLTDLQNLNSQIERYCKDKIKEDEVYTPKENEICLVKFVDTWYRGACIDVKGDGHPSILFIDFGNVSIVNIKAIRPMPKEFSHPILSTQAFIAELPDTVDDVYIEFLENCLPVNELIVADKIEIIDDNHVLHLKTTLKKLENLQ